MERSYEGMLILEPGLPEAENEDIFQKVISRIGSLNGKVSAAKIWAKERNFFYPLQSRGAEKKRQLKGCYWLVNFTLDTNKLGELRETIRLEERILRSLIVRQDEPLNDEQLNNFPMSKSE